MHIVSLSRKSLVVAIVLLAGVIGTIGWAGVAQTQAVTNRVEKHKIIEGSLYSAGEHIVVDGTVNGDVHCAGQNVVIAGTVNGDVLCAAQSLLIKGNVTGSVRAAAQDLTIAGDIGHGATLAAETLRIDKQASIKQDMTAFANDGQIAGAIGRDSVISGGLTTLSGSFGRNITYNGSNLKISDGAHVKGAIRYESDKSITIADKAVVAGDVTREKKQKTSFNAVLVLLILAACFVFSVLLVLIWPQAVHATSDIAVRSLGKTMLTGIVAALVTPFLVALVAATLIGIPLAIFIGLVSIIIMMLSGPIAAYYLGSMIMSRSKNAVAIMAVGSAVLLAVYCIPVVGMIAAIIAYFIGSGALLIALKRKTEKPDYRVV